MRGFAAKSRGLMVCCMLCLIFFGLIPGELLGADQASGSIGFSGDKLIGKGVISDLGEEQFGTLAGAVFWDNAKKKYYLLNSGEQESFGGKIGKPISCSLRPFEGNTEGPHLPAALQEYFCSDIKILEGKEGESALDAFEKDKKIRGEALNNLTVEQNNWTRKMDEFIEKQGDQTESPIPPAPPSPGK